MPTLPVSSSNRETIDDFYSTSKTISTPMVVMDVENIRGATSFRISHEALLSRIRLWREDRLSIASSSPSDAADDVACNLLEPLVWVCDHGLSPSIHHYSLFPNKNDEIVLPHNFGAIFSGGRTADDVIVDLVHLRCGGSPSFYDGNDDNKEENGSSVDADDYDNLQVVADSNNMTRNTTIVITGDARLISRCQQARRQGSSLSDVIFVEPASLLQQLERYRTSPQDEETLFGEAFSQAPTQRVRVPPPTATDGSGKSKDGKTATMTSFKTSSIAAQQHAKFQAPIHAKYKDRNISKKQQQKLYAKRFSKKRKEDMAEAAMKRKELAAKLQRHLERASKATFSDGDEEKTIIDLSRSVQGGAEILETLLWWFEERRIMIGNKNIGPIPQKAKQDDPTSLLGLDSGQVNSDDKFDPLGSVVAVPLRDGQVQSGNSVAPLRMVVISDTHGFEGALSKFASEEDGNPHSNDFLLPHADVLMHCGDFAASGSRKTQRAAARRLDEFLARQTHIPEKIVVQGNHDPDSTAKVLFPTSKAIYVRSSSTITVNGVHIALEPFSRRMAYRNARRQSAGIVTKQFQSNEEDESGSTIVINASNANSGRANRIVSGAVVVEVERHSSKIDGYQSAESTLQSRKMDDFDDYL
eukprot:scaffold177_cov245-Skeletonema_menzelii.AAC.1